MSSRSCGEMVDTVDGADCLSLGLGLSFCGKGGSETVGGSSWGGLGQTLGLGMLGTTLSLRLLPISIFSSSLTRW